MSYRNLDWKRHFYWVHCDYCPWTIGSTDAREAIAEKEHHECEGFHLGLVPVPWHRTQGLQR